ncbi:quinolinate synthase NadA [Candidatus Bathyarchaeota archaeon]|nr:quinolinate synthase NadA [Candidatus Bathyarchaeota archaeon]
MGIVDDIRRIKREKKAILLTHNYQRPEMFSITDG